MRELRVRLGEIWCELERAHDRRASLRQRLVGTFHAKDGQQRVAMSQTHIRQREIRVAVNRILERAKRALEIAPAGARERRESRHVRLIGACIG